MSQRTIQGKDYSFGEESVSIKDLRFWIDNPRTYETLFGRYDDKYMPKYPSGQLQEKIYESFAGQDSIRELAHSIEKDGLLESIIVRKTQDGKYEVLEGNRRLAACKILYDKARKRKNTKEERKLSKIRCEIAPAAISDSDIFALLGILHIKGKNPWSAYAQAKYVKRRAAELDKVGNGVELLSKEIDKGKVDIQANISAIGLMADADEEDTTKFSYYDVLVRNREVKKELGDEHHKDRWIEAIKTWEGKATDFRTAVKQSGKDPKSRKRFLDGKIDLAEAAETAIENGSTDVIVNKAKKFYEAVERNRKSIISTDSKDPVYNKLRYEFKRIAKLTGGIHVKLEERKHG